MNTSEKLMRSFSIFAKYNEDFNVHTRYEAILVAAPENLGVNDRTMLIDLGWEYMDLARGWVLYF